MINHRLTIEPTRGWKSINFNEIWQYSELLYFLTWRDIKVRYKQTLIGIFWAILQPLLTMIIFSIFFGKLVKVPSEGVPYPIFVYVGLLPWMFFSQSLMRSSESVVANTNLIKKVYFPRIITPMAASLSALIDFFIAFSVLIGLMIFYQFIPTVGILWLPALVLLTFLCSLGIGFWFSSLNVMYRDVRHMLPFFIQLGLFITPVIYAVSIVGDQWAWILYLNPMAGLIESYRSAILGYKSIPVFGLSVAIGMTGILFISGLYFYRRMERKFADVI